jgi:type II secretory pathway component PulM
MSLMDQLKSALRDSAATTYLNQAADRISPYYRQLRKRYYKLERRERMLLQVCAAVLALFVGYSLIYQSIVSYTAGLEDEVAARERDLTDVRRMAATYRQVKRELATLEKNTTLPAADFSVSAALSSALNGVVDNDKIGGINPLPNKPVSDQLTQYGAQLRLNGVTLAQVVDALYKIKSIKEPVVVSNVSIRKRAGDSHSYDVDMTCSVLGKNA